MRETISEQDAGTRLDVYLAKVHPDRSRAAWQRAIEEGEVRINGAQAKVSARLNSGDALEVIPQVTHAPQEGLPLLCVLYEDPEIVVLDKQPGVVTHPGPGHSSGTLVDALVAQYPEIRAVPSPGRPGIVHRLDKDTSGLIVVARTADALMDLQAQMQERSIEKRYLALVEGSLADDAGLIDLPIERDLVRRQQMAVQVAGKSARTYFSVLERFDGYTYVEARPVSGRTHQIRVHFAFIRHPVAGDRMYGSGRGPEGLRRQFLHAAGLAFDSPRTRRRLSFEIPLPSDLEECLSRLRRNYER